MSQSSLSVNESDEAASLHISPVIIGTSLTDFAVCTKDVVVIIKNGFAFLKKGPFFNINSSNTM
jgi:hypothetical protein